MKIINVDVARQIGLSGDARDEHLLVATIDWSMSDFLLDWRVITSESCDEWRDESNNEVTSLLMSLLRLPIFIFHLCSVYSSKVELYKIITIHNFSAIILTTFWKLFGNLTYTTTCLLLDYSTFFCRASYCLIFIVCQSVGL